MNFISYPGYLIIFNPGLSFSKRENALEHTPIHPKTFFHHGEVPRVHTKIDTDRSFKDLFGFLPGRFKHGRSVWTKRRCQDHLDDRAVIVDFYVTHQSELDDIKGKFWVNDLAESFTQLIAKFGVGDFSLPGGTVCAGNG